MTSTLLELCQDAMSEISGFEAPDYIVGNPEDTASLLLAAARRCGRQLHGKNDWQAIRKVHTFAQVSGTDNYVLPSDFARIVADTMWDTTIKRRIAGPATAHDWQKLKYASVLLWQPNTIYRVRANKIWLYPTPSTIDTIEYEYVSRNWCASAAGVEQTRWASDDDVPIIPEGPFVSGIKYWFKTAKGLPNDEDLNEYLSSVNDAIAEENQYVISAVSREYDA